MSEINQIKVFPEDEITILGYRDLARRGLGSKSTVDRKMVKKGFPKPIIDDGGKKGWTVAQVKRYLQQLISEQVAA